MKENVNNGSIHLFQVLAIKGKEKKNGYQIIILREVYQTEKDKYGILSLVQFSSVAQLSPTLCNPMDCSMPGLPVHHQLLEFTQTHGH